MRYQNLVGHKHNKEVYKIERNLQRLDLLVEISSPINSTHALMLLIFIRCHTPKHVKWYLLTDI